MAIITLTSDWGTKDHYLGAVKGKLISKLPDARIIDITHQIPVFNTTQAAFIIKNCYRDFPEGSIHIIAVNSEESDKNPHVIVEYKKQFFIGTDNGIFSLIFDEKPQQIIELSIPQDSDRFTFSTYNRFIQAAVQLAAGDPPASLGEVLGKLNEKLSFRPITDKNMIKGLVIYIDNYENIITNITEEVFQKISAKRKFEIILRGEVIRKIHQSYTDVPAGDIVALFGTHGHLEIAINQGNASSLLGLSLDDILRIEFAD